MLNILLHINYKKQMMEYVQNNYTHHIVEYIELKVYK